MGLTSKQTHIGWHCKNNALPVRLSPVTGCHHPITAALLGNEWKAGGGWVDMLNAWGRCEYGWLDVPGKRRTQLGEGWKQFSKELQTSLCLHFHMQIPHSKRSTS